MKEAFSYMFKDNKYPQKALTYFGLIFLANFAVMYAKLFAPACPNCQASPEYPLWTFIGFILMILPMGYGITCVKSLIEQKENFIIPFFNFKNSLITGLKYTLAIIFTGLAIGLGFSILGGILGVIAGMFQLKALLFVFIIAAIAFFLCFIFYISALLWIFACKGWLTSFFRWGKAFQLLSKNPKNYWKAFGLVLLVSIVSGTIANLIPVSNLLTAIIAAVISSALASYTIFVWSYLNAKAIKAECIELL